jgi:hypothetical protein
MAARFWVGGTGTWDASNTANWSATTGGAGGASVPTSSDDVTFDGSSGGGTVTVGAGYNPNVISITMGAFTGTLDFSANNNSPTMQTFSNSGAGTRALHMGSGTWTLTGNNATIWNTQSTTSTLTGSGTIICNYSGSVGNRSILTGGGSGGKIPGNLSITAGTDTLLLSGSGSFRVVGNLDFTGYAGAATFNTSYLSGDVTLSSGMTTPSNANIVRFDSVGTKTFTSNGVVFGNPFQIETVSGTLQLADNLTVLSTRDITLTQGTFNANNKNVTCGTFVSSNSNTRTITMGSGTWTLTGNNATIWTTSTTTGLTFNKGANPIICNYSGSTGTRTFNVGAVASTSLLTQPDFNITAGTDTVTFSTSTIGALNFTGFSGIWGNGTVTLWGSLLVSATMTATAGTGVRTFAGTSGTQTITSNTVSLDFPITFNGVGGTFQFIDNYTGGSTRTMTLTNGTLNTNNQNVTVGAFSSSNSNTRTLNLGSSTITLTGTGTVWNTATTTNLTLNAGTSTVNVTDTSASTKTIASGVTTLNNLTFTGVSSGAYIIGTATNTSTFNRITLVNNPNTLQFFAGKTIRVGELVANGAVASLNVLKSTVDGSPWNIAAIDSGAPYNENYISLRDSIASNSPYFYAGKNSTNVSGNVGWIFDEQPYTRPRYNNQQLLNILNGTTGRSQQFCINALAGTTGLSRKEAWNSYATTTGLSVQGAANAKASTTGRSIQDCLHILTGLGS